jgi:O-antigen ligase
VGIFLAPEVIRKLGYIEFLRIMTGVLLYFALAYHIRRSEYLTKILDALVLVAGMMSILGLIDLTTRQQTAFSPSTFGDHQLFGAFLMILFPATIMAALTEMDATRQVTARVIAALTGICLLMTGTRTAWVGAIIEILALGAFSLIATRNRKKQQTDRRQYLIPILIVVACAVLFVAMGGAGSVIGNRLNAESRTASLAYRQRMWYGAMELIKLKPLQGHGLGSFPVLQEQYTGYGRPAVDVLKTSPSLGEMAHNFWLQTTAEQGLLGSCTFAAIILTFLVAGVRRLRFLEGGAEGGVRRYLLLASMAAILGFSVDALGNPGWQYAQFSMFFWLMLGIGVACLRPKSRTP